MRRLAVALVAILLAGDVAGPATPAVAAPAARPEVAELEGLLPPGARQVISGIRILKGVGARNRVYREARSVQSELRDYYDARIETARQQLIDREQVGLEPSQLRAYMRVLARLQAERDEAIGITEDEKRAAKFGFESKLRRELTDIALRVPRIRAGLERVKVVTGDLQQAIGKAQTAIETGNPVAPLLAEVQDHLDRLDKVAQVAGMVNGRAGEAIASIGGRVRAAVDAIERPIDEALGAADGVLGELQSLDADIDAQLSRDRYPVGDPDVAAVNTPLGEIELPDAAQPVAQVVSTLVARRDARDRERAGEPFDQPRFDRMRDRVRAAVLGSSLERIGAICGRLVGLARRAQLDAAASGTAPPDTSTPCTLFGNAENLQALIDAERADDDAVAEDTSPAVVGTHAPAASAPPVEGDEGGTFESGSYELVAYTVPIEGFDWTIETGRLEVSVDDAGGVSIDGTVTWRYNISSFDGVPVCWATESYAFAGSGSADGGGVPISTVSNTSATLDGSDCSDSAELQAENIAVQVSGEDAVLLLMQPTADGGLEGLIGGSLEFGAPLQFRRAG